jgi:TRAP-type C4-dicarboxylate transport system permease small subunit
MPGLLERALRWSTGLVSALALFAIMGLTFADVTARKFMSNSITGALELTEILMVVVIFGALPLVSSHGEHVVFDSLDKHIPERLKRLQARLVHAVCSGLFGLMAWLLTTRADRFAEYGETTVQLRLPMAPVAWTMAGLLAATALVHLLYVFLPPDAEIQDTAAPAEGPR